MSWTGAVMCIKLCFDSIQDAPGEDANILTGHSIGHSKQKRVYVHVFYSERFPRWSYFSVQLFGFGAQY
jgi:hypothetical protein